MSESNTQIHCLLPYPKAVVSHLRSIVVVGDWSFPEAASRVPAT